MVLGAGVHGVYVANDLAVGGLGGEAVLLRGEERLLGVLWFGHRGNLILIHGDDVDGAAVARAVDRQPWQWRIALGPEATVDALAGVRRRRPLVHRTQLYYSIEPAGAAAPPPAEADIRLATDEDVPDLLEAALALNHDDLGVARDRVDRGWLERNITSRIRERATWVIGDPGAVRCKLDYGSEGQHGLVIEGVYTFPDHRGQGHAAKLVGRCAQTVGRQYPVVCLHVAETNTAARRSYEKAGFHQTGACRLLLW